MRKLKLAVEGLKVESFETALRRDPRGTVRGAEDTLADPCATNNMWCTYNTDELPSCGGTCDCGGTGAACQTGYTNCSGCLYASCDGVTC